MALTFAGIDLSPLTPQLSMILDRWWVKEAPALWQFPGYNVEPLHHLPIPHIPDDEPARLNTFIWPTGASRWASLYALVGGQQAAAITQSVGVISPVFRPLVISDTVQGTSITTQMLMLGLRPVFIQDDSAEVWLIQLVDIRYLGWLRQNIYTFTPGDSWETLLRNLTVAAYDVVPAIPTIPSAYGTPSPIRWTLPGKPLPLLIDAAAATVGLRLIRRLDGTFHFVNAATANANDLSRYNTNQSSLVMGGQVAPDVLIGSIPDQVTVSFWGDNPTVRSVTLASLALPDYGPSTGVSSTDAWIQADLSTNSTAGEQINYATQAATDYYLWALAVTDATFRGVRPIELTGQEDRIEWEYVPGREEQTKTESVTGPFNAKCPPERVLTRIVRTTWGDNNIYGDRAPPGYTYSVRLIERQGTNSGSGSASGSSSGSAVCPPWKARIRVVQNSQVIDGPLLGFGLDQHVLYTDCTCGTPQVGDKGIAVPDPFVPGKWLFVPANCSGGGGGSGTGTGSPTPSAACLLAGLRTTDCLDATGPSNTVKMRYAGGVWVSITDLIYPGGSGGLLFEFANGIPHLFLDGLELLWTGGNCWCGGALTGHLPGEGSGSGSASASGSGDFCSGPTFQVCIECACCPPVWYNGEGWYCIDFGFGSAAGQNCEPIYIDDETSCLLVDCPVTSGTGTGSASGGGTIASQCCTACVSVPLQWTVTIAGITENGEVCCTESNGTWILSLVQNSEAGCVWETAEQCDGNPVWSLSITQTGENCTMNLVNANGNLEYGLINPDCLSANVMNFATPPLCADAPEPVTVIPIF